MRVREQRLGAMLAFLLLGYTSTSAFIIRWPWGLVYPGTTGTTAVGATSFNYGFLRPTILLPVTTPPTTTTARPATTTPPLSQLLINALLGASGTVAIPSNNSLLINLAGALAAANNRPVVGGIAQPFPAGVAGGAAVGTPITGGIAASGGIAIPSGFPAAGGVVASGVLPGFPGILGRSANTSGGSGKVIFRSR